jgi:hypothetical protein
VRGVLEVYFFVVNRWKEVREWKREAAEDSTEKGTG